MEWVIAVVALGLGAAVGFVLARARAGARIATLETTLEMERKSASEKHQALEQATVKLGDTFKALSGDALSRASEDFLKLAKETLEKYQTEAKGDLEQRKQAVEHLVKPLKESLEKVSKQVETVENRRREFEGALAQELKSLGEVHRELRSETGNLVKALRKPEIRGRWGEVQLERVAELAGMIEHCDFRQQDSINTEEGRLRPDMVVYLPGEKQIIVDAKVPLEAYLDALSAEDEGVRSERLKAHSRQVRDHIRLLSSKSYWRQFDGSPEFVVMFLPEESFYSAALREDPSLIEVGASERVVLATPTTLIALLHAVRYGWQQERVAENAREIQRLAAELHDRVAVMGEHFGKVGDALIKSVDTYNRAVGSLETRVLPAARKFKELGVSTDKDVPELAPVDRIARLPRLAEGED